MSKTHTQTTAASTPKRNCTTCGGETFLVFGRDGEEPEFACVNCLEDLTGWSP